MTDEEPEGSHETLAKRREGGTGILITPQLRQEHERRMAAKFNV